MLKWLTRLFRREQTPLPPGWEWMPGLHIFDAISVAARRVADGKIVTLAGHASTRIELEREVARAAERTT